MPCQVSASGRVADVWAVLGSPDEGPSGGSDGYCKVTSSRIRERLADPSVRSTLHTQSIQTSGYLERRKMLQEYEVSTDV